MFLKMISYDKNHMISQTSPNMFIDGSMIAPEMKVDVSSHQASIYLFYFKRSFLNVSEWYIRLL